MNALESNHKVISLNKLLFLAILIIFAASSSIFAQSYGWGFNGAGQLGIGTTAFRVPTPVQIGQGDIVKISPNYNHNLALKADGTVLAWGNNSYGKLGDNTIMSRLSPVPVMNLTDVVDVASGEEFSIAVKSDGTVWTWGSNTRGQLGLGSTDGSSHPLPVQILGLTDVIAVNATYQSTLALKSDGTVWAWGQNVYGQIGNNTSNNNITSPTKVSNLTDVVEIATGYNHSVALKSDGTVWVWGNGSEGQVGNNTLENPTIPRQSTISGVSQITSGTINVAALKANGDVFVWGDNDHGQIGNGTNGGDARLPRQSSISNVVEIKFGGYHLVARLSDGSVKDWGRNRFGQLGDGTFTNGKCDCTSSLPVTALVGNGNVSISAGVWHTFALNPQISTPSGSNISLMGTNVKMNFDAVKGSGMTSYSAIDSMSTGLGVPFGYEIQANQPAYSISTSAITSGNIEVCLQAPNISDNVDFNSLKIMHEEDGVLIDRTISHDIQRREICASSESLDSFVIAQRLTPSAEIVEVAGGVVDVKGNPIPNSFVSISDSGGVIQTVRTNQFGYYLFQNVEAGNAYTFDVTNRNHTFATRVVAINDFVKDLIFVAQ